MDRLLKILHFVCRDMHALQKCLSVFLPDIAIAQVLFRPIAHAFDLGAEQLDSMSRGFLNEIVLPCLAVRVSSLKYPPCTQLAFLHFI
jgi:hypothetical protein